MDFTNEQAIAELATIDAQDFAIVQELLETAQDVGNDEMADACAAWFDAEFGSPAVSGLTERTIDDLLDYEAELARLG